MSRQGNEPESQIVRKRPRQEDRLVQHPRSSSIPRSIVSSVQGFDVFPIICGFQDNMSNWMSSLIQQMGAFKWLLKGLILEESNKSSWHMPLPKGQRCHLQMIKYHIYVRN